MIARLQSFYTQEDAQTQTSHTVGKQATEAFEATRSRIARHFNAARPEEIIFLRGATEALNLVAIGFTQAVLQPGDEVLLTQAEHHSNIVPWLIACKPTGAKIKVAPITPAGELDLDQFQSLLTNRTRIVGITHVSNVLGTIYPVKQVVEMAHKARCRRGCGWR